MCFNPAPGSLVPFTTLITRIDMLYLSIRAKPLHISIILISTSTALGLLSLWVPKIRSKCARPASLPTCKLSTFTHPPESTLFVSLGETRRESRPWLETSS
jgi:hypothetical protein